MTIFLLITLIDVKFGICRIKATSNAETFGRLAKAQYADYS